MLTPVTPNVPPTVELPDTDSLPTIEVLPVIMVAPLILFAAPVIVFVAVALPIVVFEPGFDASVVLPVVFNVLLIVVEPDTARVLFTLVAPLITAVPPL